MCLSAWFCLLRHREPFRSEALAIELKDNDCGVTVTTLCPGPTEGGSSRDTRISESKRLCATGRGEGRV
ncbi:MAG: hypothetical protein DMF48_09135 [Verrucomicrobia bacterium]|nr:MAG: hypothetical protein DMF05_00320 [Verrucomicrobiota bacterium]PYL11007.1 MAG: hypothetical protein DMF48_09135 [Verrucomicrobiota bacterium]